MNHKLRRLPAHAINRRLKARRVRQQDVANMAGCSIAYVSATISRKTPPSDKRDRVWAELERILGGAA